MGRRLWRLALWSILLAILLHCGGEGSGYPLAPGRPDPAFDALFARRGDGWTGGDGTYSVLLPDGRTVWLFGDSFLGTINSDGTRAPGPLIHNALVVQDGTSLTTLYTGTPDDPSAFFNPPVPDEWYWPGDGTVSGDHLYIFLSTFHQAAPGMWGFEYAGRDDLAILSLPDLTLARIVTVSQDPGVIDGVAILETADTTYIYGVEKEFAHVARAAPGNLAGPWEYFDGTGWTPDPQRSARLLGGVSNQFSVIAWQGRYRLITQQPVFSPQIVIYEADQPVGPWHGARLVYRTPESGERLFTYNAVAHPQFTQDGELLISYNVNSFAFADLFADATVYRPRFIRVPLGN
jgi:hypothetical protein